MKLPVAAPFGIPLCHFRFVVALSHALKSAVQCDFAFRAIGPNIISN